MELYAKCPICQNETFFPVDAITRVDLYQQKGSHWEEACMNCGAVHAYHLDDIKARVSPSRKLLSILLIGFFLFLFLGLLFGVGLILFSTIPGYLIHHLKQEEANKIHRFNSYQIGRE